MGRYYYNAKKTVEEACDLSIYGLRKQGMLVGHASTVITWVNSRTRKETNIGLIIDITGEPYARFYYVVTDAEGNPTDYDYKVSLVTTPCNFGGVRYRFGCPWCFKRVGFYTLRRVMFTSGVGTATICHIIAGMSQTFMESWGKQAGR